MGGAWMPWMRPLLVCNAIATRYARGHWSFTGNRMNYDFGLRNNWRRFANGHRRFKSDRRNYNFSMRNNRRRSVRRFVIFRIVLKNRRLLSKICAWRNRKLQGLAVEDLRVPDLPLGVYWCFGCGMEFCICFVLTVCVVPRPPCARGQPQADTICNEHRVPNVRRGQPQADTICNEHRVPNV